MAPLIAVPDTLPIWVLVTQLMHATESPSAEVAPKLLMAYGVDAIGCRGSRVVKLDPEVGLTAISTYRAAPLKHVAQAPKSSCTVKMPADTVTVETVTVPPCCVPVPSAEVSKSLNWKSYWPLAGLPLSESLP